MANIALFGDSITWGSWDPEGGGWAGRLWIAACSREDLADPTTDSYAAVFNRGIPGDKLADVLMRFDHEATVIQPVVTVLAIGINDIRRSNYPGTPYAEFETGYNILIDKAFALGSDVVVVTPTNVDEARPEHDYRNSEIKQYVDIIQHVARQRDLPIVDVFGQLTTEDLYPDGLHPGAAGHEKLYRAIEPVVLGREVLRNH